ncbi:hypothetical protein WMY93_023158 [Mugilogobius chulae]|uniref:Uncharacterized protein n=1 Tax=Mugilogobius chulae TaxID=88201 RepID=A0AAW0NEJ5_9GOBI
MKSIFSEDCSGLMRLSIHYTSALARIRVCLNENEPQLTASGVTGTLQETRTCPDQNSSRNAMDDPSVNYGRADGDDSGTEHVHENQEMVQRQHLALVTQEDGTQQQVAIMAPDMSSFQTVEEAAYAQDQDGPVTLLATSNGTHIAVQLSESPSLEEAIRIASRIQQGESPGLED